MGFSVFKTEIMAKLKLRGKHLQKLGYPQSSVIGLAINIFQKEYKRLSTNEALEKLKLVVESPKDFVDDRILGPIARGLITHHKKEEDKVEIPIAEVHKSFPIYGQAGIEEGALNQMYTAMRLPITVKGALMPDAHQGYGLPIGGVLAVENAVIPYGVGMDIGCRMALSIYDLPPENLETDKFKFKKLLGDNARFGFETFDDPMDDAVLERPEFREISIIKKLKNKAAAQIGSSGSGNHFVEFGIVEMTDPKNELKLPIGKYLALLTHSGSRGLGANIAQHYTKIAMQKCKLPKSAKNLAWLDLNSEEGQEYWLAMNLAGDYASACHNHIHIRMAKSLGIKPLAKVENHHNFAWKEKLSDGREVIVHRKGATPAGKDVLGVIPGSMTAPGYIVRGKGNFDALNSASHGAGRTMSRSKAKQSITKGVMKNYLAERGVELIGGDLDEAPMAYKDIEKVMAYHHELVEILGKFYPKIVRMAD